MQALIDKFGTNATYLAGALVALVILVIALFLINSIFGRRIRSAGGGRSRQPRLGVVDAYDLDRQRQLVLVRRDNVEHLVMIGGPNDVLIESTIIRSAAVGEMRPRVAPSFDEVPAAVAPPAPVAPPAAPPPAPAPVLRSPPPPPLMPAALVPSMDELVQAVTPPRPVPAPQPVAPRIAPPPPPAPRPLPKLEVPPPRPAPAPAVPAAAPAASQTPAAPAVPAVADGEPARKRFDFGRLVNRTPAEPAIPAPSLAAPAPAAAPPMASPDPVDALELEMAKLLGRPPSQGG